MKLLTCFSALCCASTAFAASRNVFNKPKPLLEKRTAGQPFKHPEIQKRASRFLTDKTERKYVGPMFEPEAQLEQRSRSMAPEYLKYPSTLASPTLGSCPFLMTTMRHESSFSGTNIWPSAKDPLADSFQVFPFNTT